MKLQHYYLEEELIRTQAAAEQRPQLKRQAETTWPEHYTSSNRMAMTHRTPIY
jgi:hypothetical protein